MITWLQNSWKTWFTRRSTEALVEMIPEPRTETPVLDFDIAPNDPLLPYLLSVSGVVDVQKLNLDSPALRSLKEAGVMVSVPLVSQGELIGLLNLGPRRSEQEYSADDRRLLANLATQAAPALRVAQLVRQQQAEALERERIQQELRVARVIQQTLLPKEVPDLPGWRMAAHWQPARAVSGDFYDFIPFSDGRMAIVLGDVTDKGVPAALVMATTRSILRSTAEHLVSPGAVLEQANNRLCPDIPQNMFVTCLYMLLDPKTGELCYANAGHNLPFQHTRDEIHELRARGMPLGLMPGMEYEEKSTNLSLGDSVILYSDGLIEAHNPDGDMFGTPRLRALLAKYQCREGVIECLLGELEGFTGSNWEQEDDVTLLLLERTAASPEGPGAGYVETRINEAVDGGMNRHGGLETDVLLAEFSLASQPGNEREAMKRVAAVAEKITASKKQIERLKTAVAEATMNAMEHGNRYQPEIPVDIKVSRRGAVLVVSVCDCGGGKDIPESEVPDLSAKLEGTQSPRGWGLFLIKNMVDDIHVRTDARHHIVELVVDLEGE